MAPGEVSCWRAPSAVSASRLGRGHRGKGTVNQEPLWLEQRRRWHKYKIHAGDMMSRDASEVTGARVLLPLPEKLVRASLLLLVSAMARLNCSRMVLSSDERCSVLCSATRRRSFKAWNSLWYAISFSVTKSGGDTRDQSLTFCLAEGHL